MRNLAQNTGSSKRLCWLCDKPIGKGELNRHHEVYRSQGGTNANLRDTHKDCHVALHSTRNDFRTWGRIGGIISAGKEHWAFYLKGVRESAKYSNTRARYTERTGRPAVVRLDERDMLPSAWRKPANRITVKDVNLTPQQRKAKRIVLTLGDAQIPIRG